MTPAPQEPKELPDLTAVRADDTIRITYDLGGGCVVTLQGRVQHLSLANSYINFHTDNKVAASSHYLFQRYASRQVLLLDRPKKLTPITLDQLLTLPFGTEVHGVSGSAPFQGTVLCRYQNHEGYLELLLKGANGHQGLCLRGYQESLNFDPKTLRAKI